MKIMNVSFSIDVSNIEHVQALEAFTRALGGLSPLTTTPGTTSATLTTTPGTAEQESEKKAPAKRASRAKAPVAPAPEPETEETDEEESWLEEEEAEEESAEVEIDHVLLRSMVAERRDKHRPALKAKFEEMGVANVSSIPENKLKAFHAFLLTLKA